MVKKGGKKRRLHQSVMFRVRKQATQHLSDLLSQKTKAQLGAPRGRHHPGDDRMVKSILCYNSVDQTKMQIFWIQCWNWLCWMLMFFPYHPYNWTRHLLQHPMAITKNRLWNEANHRFQRLDALLRAVDQQIASAERRRPLVSHRSGSWHLI